MSVWRWIWALVRCPHDEMIRERWADGSYHVRCSRCGYVTRLLREADNA